MLIICPKCFTQYKIPDESASLVGKKCHCSACGCYFEHKDDVVELKQEEIKKERTVLEKTMDIFDVPEKEEKMFFDEPHEPISLSLFNEPLKEMKEPKFTKDPFDYVPEEFKPVQPKKTSLISLVLWLGIGFGICYAAYSQKDFLLQVMNQTIEKAFGSNEKTFQKEKKSIEPVVQKMEPARLDEKSVQQVVSETLPQLKKEEKESPVVDKKEMLSSSGEINERPFLPIKEGNEKMVDFQEKVSLSEEVDGIKEMTPLSEQQELQANTLPVINPPLQSNEGSSQMPVDGVQEGINEIQNGQIAPISALEVQNVSYEIGMNEVGTRRLLIKGVIVNTSVYQGRLPLTKAVVYDYSDRVVARKRIHYLEKVIDGNSELSFETQVVPAPANVSKIEVNFDE